MDNTIGFRRNIYLDWIDAAGAAVAAGDDAIALRAHLDPVVALTVHSAGNRRVALTILTNIWLNSRRNHPDLHAEAIRLYTTASAPADRLWLHYGLTMIAYPFFHQTVRVVGQQCLRQDSVASVDVKSAMIADRGHLGALETAIERVLFTLRSWGMLIPTARKGRFTPVTPRLAASTVDLQAWLLAAALTVHSGEEIPYLDLLRHPELFPFAFTVTLDHLRRHPWFAVQRQGAALDMVRLAAAV